MMSITAQRDVDLNKIIASAHLQWINKAFFNWEEKNNIGLKK